MAVLAVILARAGSKGLPCKNALTVAGRPMLAWTIDHALASRCVDRVVLTTDGSALAEIGRSCGVEVIDRPAELATDGATVADAARHALMAAEHGEGEAYDPVVILYGNVPVRPAGLVDRAVALMRETGCDSVQSVCDVGKAHPYWTKRLGAGSRLEPFMDNTVDRRQDLPPLYLLDGGLIVVRRTVLRDSAGGDAHAFLGVDRRAVVTEPGEVIDVDNERDRLVAEAVLVHGNDRATARPAATIGGEGGGRGAGDGSGEAGGPRSADDRGGDGRPGRVRAA